jgi:hypothetical protein
VKNVLVCLTAVAVLAMTPREAERLSVAGKPMATTSPLLAPNPPVDTNAPDLWFQWAASPNPNITGYRLYYGRHYPQVDAFSDWPSTNAFVTNAPLFNNDFWVTARAGTNETVPSLRIVIVNGYQFTEYTFSTLGTGRVDTSSTLITWTPLKTNANFTGTFLVLTNPAGNQFFKGPRVTWKTRSWNL